MPAPTLPLPATLPTLHVYRHMLREVTYLPPAFGSRIVSIIRQRFHRHQHDAIRPAEHIKKAQKALRQLRAANSGDKKAMESLIHKGFGRTGLRRRRLFGSFARAEAPKDSEALDKLIDASTEASASQDADGNGIEQDEVNSSNDQYIQLSGGKKARLNKNTFFERWDQKKIQQILTSQRSQQGQTKKTTSWSTKEIRNKGPDRFVPETNIWGKPPSFVVVRAKRAHWWRSNADKMMPPLEPGEWDLLKGLGSGLQDTAEWKIPDRRLLARPLSQPADQVSPAETWQDHATKPAHRAESTKAFLHRRRTGHEDKGPYGVRGRNTPLSARWFRRAYNRTWQVTPRMDQDPKTLKYSFAWGRPQVQVPTATEAQLAMFEHTGSSIPKSKS